MGIERRLEKLEQAVGGGGCDTCSGWFAVVVNGKLDPTKNPPRRYGRPASVEEYLRFRHTADAGGKCPACGREPYVIRVVGERLSE